MPVILGLSLMPTQMDLKTYETIHNFLIAFLLIVNRIVIWMFSSSVWKSYYVIRKQKRKSEWIQKLQALKKTELFLKILMCLNFIRH
jgi:hypothetical protein